MKIRILIFNALIKLILYELIYIKYSNLVLQGICLNKYLISFI